MPIEAPIKELGLFEAFQLISITDKKGLLLLVDEVTASTYKLFFRDGKLIHIDIQERMEEELCKRGFLSREQIEEAGKDNLLIGVVENKLLDESLVETLYTRIATETIYSLFLIKRGHFSFREKDFSYPDYLTLGMKIENIILEAARRMDEISKMEEMLPSRDIILEVSGDVFEMDEIELSPIDWKLISLIDGERTIGDIIEEVGDEFSVLKSLYGMTMTGIITEKKLKIEQISKSEKSRKERSKVYSEIKRLWNKGMHEEGISYIKEMKKKFPEDNMLIYELGFFYLSGGQFKECISEWNSFLTITEDDKKKNEIRDFLEIVKKLHKKLVDREVYFE